jgi:hypothetical protein
MGVVADEVAYTWPVEGAEHVSGALDSVHDLVLSRIRGTALRSVLGGILKPIIMVSKIKSRRDFNLPGHPLRICMRCPGPSC